MKIDEFKSLLLAADKKGQKVVAFSNQTFTSSVEGIPFQKLKHLERLEFNNCIFEGSHNVMHNRSGRNIEIVFRGCNFPSQNSLTISAVNESSALTVNFTRLGGGLSVDKERNHLDFLQVRGYVQEVGLLYLNVKTVNLEIKSTSKPFWLGIFSFSLRAKLYTNFANRTNVRLYLVNTKWIPTITAMFPGIPVETICTDDYLYTEIR
jgi:hypothetical protein